MDGDDESDDQTLPTAADAFETALGKAIASNDVAEVGHLSMSRDVNWTRITLSAKMAKPLRNPQFGLPVLNVAVGPRAVEVAKYLLEATRRGRRGRR
jgi:hypothetical protein